MPPVVRAGDDLLHVAKLAVSTALGDAVYIVDDDDRYLGAVSNGRLARRVFEQLDPSLFVSEHEHATTGLLHLGRCVAAKPSPTRCARFIMRRGARPLSLTTRGNCWASSGRSTSCASGSKTRCS